MATDVQDEIHEAFPMELVLREPSATFMARRSALRIVYESGYNTHDARGNKHEHPGVALEWTQGRLIVDEKLAKRLGASVDELLTFLRAHERYNDSQEGFFELEDMPPSPAELQGMIAALAADENVAAIEEILRLERENWKRQEITVTCEVVLEAFAVKNGQPLPEEPDGDAEPTG